MGSTQNVHLPLYAQNAPTGQVSPRGVLVLENSTKMAKGLVKMAKALHPKLKVKTKMPKRRPRWY